MDVRFIDTTLRDGAQSLWALGLRSGMIEAVGADLDRAGFDAVEVPVYAIYMKTLLDGLTAWLDVRDVDSVSRIRGRMSRHAMSDATAFERANYIKILQGWSG